MGLRAAGRGLDAAAASRLDERVGRRLDDHPRGRFLRAAVNGLIGDRLADERPRWAIPLAVRVDGRDVELTAEGVRTAYPAATGRIVVFLHGLCEDESSWRRRRDVRGTTYAEGLAAHGWTPVMLRANTGLTLRANGAALTAVLQQLTQACRLRLPRRFPWQPWSPWSRCPRPRRLRRKGPDRSTPRQLPPRKWRRWR